MILCPSISFKIDVKSKIEKGSFSLLLRLLSLLVAQQVEHWLAHKPPVLGSPRSRWVHCDAWSGHS
jgi:hypothetical protein